MATRMELKGLEDYRALFQREADTATEPQFKEKCEELLLELEILNENFLKQGIAPGNGITNDENIRIKIELIGSVAFHQLDSLRLELGTHGRIDIGIAAGHPMAGSPSQKGNASHEGAADTEDVNMHAIFRQLEWRLDSISRGLP